MGFTIIMKGGFDVTLCSIMCTHYKRDNCCTSLKRHNQGKFTYIFFFFFNMAIRCDYVHRLELWKSFKSALLCQCVKCAVSSIYQLLPYFLFWTCMAEIKFRIYYGHIKIKTLIFYDFSLIGSL